MSKEDNKNFSLKELFTCVFSYFKDRPYITSLIVFLFILSSLSEAVGISALLVILVDFFDGGSSENKIILILNNFFQFFNINLDLKPMLAVFFVAIFFKAIILFGSLYISSITAVNLSKNIRGNLVNELIGTKFSFLVNLPIGRIITHLNDESDRVAIFYVKFCRAINLLVQAFIYSLIAVIASWQISFSLIFFALMVALILQQFNKIFYKIGQEFLNIKRLFNNNISNLFSSIKPLKAMGLENFGANSIQSDINRIQKNMKRYWLYESALLSLQEPFSFIFIVFYVVISVTFFGVPIITSLFVAVLFYRLSRFLLSFYTSIRSLASFLPSINSINDVKKSAQREKEYFKGKNKVYDVKQIKFKNINFKYKKNIIFQNFSLNLNLQKITFVEGKSGIGKTTFVDLITGLFQPDKGSIFLDGKNIKDIDLVNWRKQIGYVSQDPSLFGDTILNNLTLSKDYNSNDLEAILKLTFCDSFINKYERKLKTVIGNRGSKMSGGQRQRMAIARALLQKPKLLILDEATSELNATLEKQLLINIANYKELKGIIIISHNTRNKKIAEQYLKIANNKITKKK